VPDYHRLVRMLVGGGELDGVRLLSPRTVRWMTTNQLPGGADLHQLGRRVLFGQPTYRGLGFGFNVQTVVDATATRLLISPDEFSWYSGYSTLFLADPVEELVVVFFASFTPVKTYPLYSRVRQLVYQAMVA
jgi:CubicO group peptidase (beta-lactamase class C family)